MDSFSPLADCTIHDLFMGASMKWFGKDHKENRRALLSLALVCRAVGRAAQRQLYAVICPTRSPLDRNRMRDPVAAEASSSRWLECLERVALSRPSLLKKTRVLLLDLSELSSTALEHIFGASLQTWAIHMVLGSSTAEKLEPVRLHLPRYECLQHMWFSSDSMSVISDLVCVLAGARRVYDSLTLVECGPFRLEPESRLRVRRLRLYNVCIEEAATDILLSVDRLRLQELYLGFRDRGSVIDPFSIATVAVEPYLQRICDHGWPVLRKLELGHAYLPECWVAGLGKPEKLPRLDTLMLHTTGVAYQGNHPIYERYLSTLPPTLTTLEWGALWLSADGLEVTYWMLVTDAKPIRNLRRIIFDFGDYWQIHDFTDWTNTDRLRDIAQKFLVLATERGIGIEQMGAPLKKTDFMAEVSEAIDMHEENPANQSEDEGDVVNADTLANEVEGAADAVM